MQFTVVPSFFKRKINLVSNWAYQVLRYWGFHVNCHCFLFVQVLKEKRTVLNPPGTTYQQGQVSVPSWVGPSKKDPLSPGTISTSKANPNSRFQPFFLGNDLVWTHFSVFSRFYWVLLSFTGLYWVLPGFTGFYRVLPGFRVLLGFTGFYRVSLGFTGF